MSGGSWNYAYGQIESIACELRESSDPLRRMLGERLALFVEPMHDIEWVDSCDYGPGDDRKAIETALRELGCPLTEGAMVARQLRAMADQLDPKPLP